MDSGCNPSHTLFTEFVKEMWTGQCIEGSSDVLRQSPYRICNVWSFPSPCMFKSKLTYPSVTFASAASNRNRIFYLYLSSNTITEPFYLGGIFGGHCPTSCGKQGQPWSYTWLDQDPKVVTISVWYVRSHGSDCGLGDGGRELRGAGSSEHLFLMQALEGSLWNPEHPERPKLDTTVGGMWVLHSRSPVVASSPLSLRARPNGEVGCVRVARGEKPACCYSRRSSSGFPVCPSL